MVKLNTTDAIPPLRDGDRLTQREFFRRYEAAPEGTRAELLRGVVYLRRWVISNGNGERHVMPPISSGHHSEPSGEVYWFLRNYALFTTGVRAGTPVTVKFDSPVDSSEPDSLLRILPEYGGACAVGADDYVHGPPELIAEIANTSAATDLGVKYETYEANGVAEYIVWRTVPGVLDWFVLKRKKYVSLLPDPADGYLKSVVFPGLWLDVTALLAGEGRTVMAVLQQGLATPEHAAFEAKLAATAAKNAKPKKRK